MFRQTTIPSRQIRKLSHSENVRSISNQNNVQEKIVAFFKAGTFKDDVNQPLPLPINLFSNVSIWKFESDKGHWYSGLSRRSKGVRTIMMTSGLTTLRMKRTQSDPIQWRFWKSSTAIERVFECEEGILHRRNVVSGRRQTTTEWW